MDFESTRIFTEKDLLNMGDETEYVINILLKKERVEEKKKNNDGYVGTVEEINGEYRKKFDENNLKKVKELA